MRLLHVQAAAAAEKGAPPPRRYGLGHVSGRQAPAAAGSGRAAAAAAAAAAAPSRPRQGQAAAQDFVLPRSPRSMLALLHRVLGEGAAAPGPSSSAPAAGGGRAAGAARETEQQQQQQQQQEQEEGEGGAAASGGGLAEFESPCKKLKSPPASPGARCARPLCKLYLCCLAQGVRSSLGGLQNPPARWRGCVDL